MKRIITLVIVSLTLTTCTTYAKSNDYEIAKQWAKNHGGKYTITKVVTISKGGTKGNVKGTKYIVRYPRKVKKGKRVVCYMIEKNGDVKAMVCCGKVK